jgi:muramoyltetrapeptide carboxypeptidase
LLPYLDAALVRANPKAFVGYSDHTSLHIWLAKECGLISFYGPMVAADFSRQGGAEIESWHHSLSGDSQWALGPEEGMRSLQAGFADGAVFGGCISIFTEALGTPYAIPVAEPDEPRILFLEDIGTKPYKWDRFLVHMRFAAMLENVTGIVFGDMRQCVGPDEDALLDAALRHALRDFPGPIAIGLRCGHVDAPNTTVPFGVRARLDADAEGGARLTFLEPATQSQQ